MRVHGVIGFRCALQVQSKICIDLCKSEAAYYDIRIPQAHPGGSDIAGLLTATVDSLPSLTWQRVFSVRGLAHKVTTLLTALLCAVERITFSAVILHVRLTDLHGKCVTMQVDINLADSDRDICTPATAKVDSDKRTSRSADAHGRERSDAGSFAEAAAPHPLLWECLHRQCSKDVIADMLQCKAELPIWQPPDPQPTCAAHSMHVRDTERSSAGAEDSVPWAAFLWIPVLFVAAQATLATVIWTCRARSATCSVAAEGLETKQTDHLNLRPEAIALARPVRSSGTS